MSKNIALKKIDLIIKVYGKDNFVKIKNYDHCIIGFDVQSNRLIYSISLVSGFRVATFSSFAKTKGLNTCTDLAVCTELGAGLKMPTITLSMPEEFEKAKKKYSQVNWNELIKQGIIKKLEEFEKLKEEGKI